MVDIPFMPISYEYFDPFDWFKPDSWWYSYLKNDEKGLFGMPERLPAGAVYYSRDPKGGYAAKYDNSFIKRKDYRHYK